MPGRPPQLCTTICVTAPAQPNGQGSHVKSCHVSLSPTDTGVGLSVARAGSSQVLSSLFSLLLFLLQGQPQTVLVTSHGAHRDPLKCSQSQGGSLLSRAIPPAKFLHCAAGGLPTSMASNPLPSIPTGAPGWSSLPHTNPAGRMGPDCQGITSITGRGPDSSGDFVSEAPRPRRAGCENSEGAETIAAVN